MVNYLNTNEGVVAAVGVLVSIVIAVIGFFINKNIAKIRQNQRVGNNSRALQAGGNITDKSVSTKK